MLMEIVNLLGYHGTESIKITNGHGDLPTPVILALWR